ASDPPDASPAAEAAAPSVDTAPSSMEVDPPSPEVQPTIGTRMLDDFEDGLTEGVSPETGLRFSWHAWVNTPASFGSETDEEARIASEARWGRDGKVFDFFGAGQKGGTDLFVELHPGATPDSGAVDLSAYEGIEFYVGDFVTGSAKLTVAMKD